MNFSVVKLLTLVFSMVCFAACAQPDADQPVADTSDEVPLADATIADVAVADESSSPGEAVADAIQEKVSSRPESPMPLGSSDVLNNRYSIHSPMGTMVVRLYDETPLHRDNFMKLVEEDILEQTLFHRVINGFMIQGGDPYSKNDDPLDDGQGGPGYNIPAEIDRRLYHKRGALAAARQPDQVNPEKESSGSQFYIIHGRTWTDEELTQIENGMRQTDPGFTFSAEQRAVYITEGGYPPLDGGYTVFGELVAGFDVLDKIASVQTTGTYGRPPDRPLTDILMSVARIPGR